MKKKSNRMRSKYTIKAVDLFCGAGGLTKGLRNIGIDVQLGVDLDPACEYPYTSNNESRFLLKSVVELQPSELTPSLLGGDYSLIAGCAPCQTFSSYSLGKKNETDARWNLLSHFGSMVVKLNPDFVTMENVPGLRQQKVFHDFLKTLHDNGYKAPFVGVVNGADYGLPQSRQRLIVLASKLGPMKLIAPTHQNSPITVKDALSGLTSLQSGEMDPDDELHQTSALSPLNLKRIQASRPGGTWRDWPKHLVAECHKKESGKTFAGVYGRMKWDSPAPTITTQFFGFGNGRFGHPEQNRALSFREGAILQGFPKKYKFIKPGEPIIRRDIGRMIGNAVPVKLGEVIGRSILAHIKEIKTRL